MRFSPAFTTDRTLLALVTDGTDTFIMAFSGGISRLTPLKHSDSGSVVAVAGTLTLPSDFTLETNSQFYIAVDGGDAYKGGVWLGFYQAAPQEPVAFPLTSNLNEDFTCLSAGNQNGGYHLTAGTISGNIYTSADGGITWQAADKNPGGSRIDAVVNIGDSLYASSSGIGSGISKSTDLGANWKSTAMIDQDHADTLVKIMPSPDYASDGTLYLLSFNSGHTVWQTTNEGLSWRRLIGTGDYGITTIEQITVANDSALCILAGTGGNGVCLVSTDGGGTFETLSLPVPVNNASRFAAESITRIFFSTYDGTLAQIWQRDSSQVFRAVAAGDQRLSTLELSPAFHSDQTVIATAADGSVLISTDAGNTFTSLPDLPLDGEITLIFDPDFSTSGKIYAANDIADTGIHRLTIGDAAWVRIDSGLPADSLISGLAITRDNIIYASSYTTVSDNSGGLIRALSEGAAWYLTRTGLPNGATLKGVAVIDRRIWTLDTTNNRIMVYTDTLADPVQLTSPSPAAGGLGDLVSGIISGIDIKWQPVNGAGSYLWQVNDSAGMSAPLFEGTAAASTVRLNLLKPNMTYYWRVRALTPVPGPWSDKRFFTTALGGTFSVPELITPPPGAVDQNLRPIFQWQPVADADTYDLILGTDSGLNNPVINQTHIPGNAWQSETALESGKTYYWKVRAVSAATNSAWSAVSGFAVAKKVLQPENTAPSPTATTTIIQTIDMAIPEWLGLTIAGMGGAIVLLLLVLAATARNRRGL